jgi:hypothetical protein
LREGLRARDKSSSRGGGPRKNNLRKTEKFAVTERILVFLYFTHSSVFAVPEDLTSTLQKYTEQGYRVIALGRRTLSETSYTKIQRMRREDVEHDLEFLGMIVLENRLKPETEPVIGILKAACMKTVMVTGRQEKEEFELYFLGKFLLHVLCTIV